MTNPTIIDLTRNETTVENIDGKIVVSFTQAYHKCPRYLHNFLNETLEHSDREDFEADVQRAAKKYNATYDTTHDIMTFSSEQDFSFFLLRYS